MKSGTLTQTLRPLKLAFLVDLSEPHELLKVIALNSYLWGGPFNPIVPVFKRTPRAWSNKFLRSPKARDILDGYLSNYDPDFLVTVGKVESKQFEGRSRPVIEFDQILDSIQADGSLSYGVGLFELLRHLIGTEMRYVRQSPIRFLFPNFNEKDLFLTSIFGALPKRLEAVFTKHYASVMKPEYKPCTTSNYGEFLEPGLWFFRRLSCLFAGEPKRRSFDRGDCLYFMDPTRSIDIVDYWNLRAVGWTVIPVAKKSLGEVNIQKLCLDFIQERYSPYRGNPQIYHMATLMKSRSMAEAEFGKLTKDLMAQIPSGPNKPRVILSGNYPRLWDEWARDKDGAECGDLEADTRDVDLVENEGQINFRSLDPNFIESLGGGGMAPRFANLLDLKFFGEKEPLAEAIPEADNRLANALNMYGGHEWRFSRKGIVYLGQHTNWRIAMPIPHAEDLMIQWFKMQGWPVKLSSPGKVAKQMLRQLGGGWGLNTLAEEGIINLLLKLSEGKSIDQQAFQAEINKIANASKYRRSPEALLKRLVDTQVVRLGLDVQCEACGMHSWYSLKEADYELCCPLCLEKFAPPTHSVKELHWSYKANGPFALPGKAYGVYATLLTLRFFARSMHVATSPLLSFMGKLENHEVEIDLALLYQESKFNRSDVETIFAECKTSGELESKDIRRMKIVARRFPGAILVFSTLKKEYGEREKRLLKPLVKKGRRYLKAGKAYNPVLILTAHELFAETEPPYCWKDAGGTMAKFANFNLHEGIQTLCDLTQQIHLGMESSAAFHEHRRLKRSARLAERLRATGVDNFGQLPRGGVPPRVDTLKPSSPPDQSSPQG